MWSPWRLPKKKMDLLELPELPKSYYWVITKGEFAKAEVRKRILWPFVWSTVASNYVYGDKTNRNKSAYVSAVKNSHQSFKNMMDSWQSNVESWAR